MNMPQLSRLASTALLAMTLAACNATTGTVKHKPARIDIQEAVGFTITEEARVPGEVRVDYDEALAMLEQGRVQDGAALLETVANEAPGLSAPRIDLGIAYHRLGDLEAAEKHLKRALELNPRHPIALNELGIVYRKTARFAEARKSYEAALAVYPGYHFARRNLAVLCDLYLADLSCALTNYEAYLATVDSDKEVSMWLRDVRYRSGTQE
ncbi:MAG: tetratricopeptide repeat protein [Woeseiaceae bacterium]|nr:tetratricopeptide repeat protein [Woeseiaceae bacterium]